MGGLKRHPALQPFSRDHLIGLFHAQKLMKLESSVTPELLEDTIKAFAEAWEREISIHFADEDRLLGPLPINDSSLERLHHEHIDLTSDIAKLFETPYSAQDAVRIGAFLDAHIRWEEHELFPEVEASLSEDALIALEKETQKIEKSRRRKL